MRRRSVACPACENLLPRDFENADEFLSCPRCVNLVRVFAFPALQRPSGTARALTASDGGEATCFYHPRKQAGVICDSCGRFLCALCDVEIGSAHLCPRCIESNKRRRTPEAIDSRRILYDNLALTTAIVPLLMWPVTLFSAPATMFVVIRYWRALPTVLPRTKIRFVIAFLIAVAQVVGWAMLFYFIFARARRGR